MSHGEQVLLTRPGASWLPDGGVAEVVLAGPGSATPRPTCLVRLLAAHEGRILVGPRPDGRGLDIPTRAVDGAVIEDILRALMLDVLREDVNPVLHGWVRNVVPDAADDYPWPRPDAHFVVWRCAVADEAAAHGVWLDDLAAERELGARHWWPLVAHLP